MLESLLHLIGMDGNCLGQHRFGIIDRSLSTWGKNVWNAIVRNHLRVETDLLLTFRLLSFFWGLRCHKNLRVVMDNWRVQGKDSEEMLKNSQKWLFL